MPRRSFHRAAAVRGTLECRRHIHADGERREHDGDRAQLRVGFDRAVLSGTANAAAEWKNGTMYIGTVTNKSFVVTHTNNAQTDRTFMYAAVG